MPIRQLLLWSSVGYLAGTLSIVMLVIFLVKLFRYEKDGDHLKSVSLKTYTIYVASCVVWTLFAALSWAYAPSNWVKNLAVIIPNVICAVLGSFIWVIKKMDDIATQRLEADHVRLKWYKFTDIYKRNKTRRLKMHEIKLEQHRLKLQQENLKLQKERLDNEINK